MERQVKDPNFAAPSGKTRVVRVYEHGLELVGDYDNSLEAFRVADAGNRRVEAKEEHNTTYMVYNDAGELARGAKVLTNMSPDFWWLHDSGYLVTS